MEKGHSLRVKKISKKLLFKYRIIVMDETTLDELTSFRLNRLNIFVYSSLFAILLIIFTSIIIIYSPLRQYVLGFSEAELKREIVKITFATDSLEQSIQNNKAYFASIQQVLKGEVQPEQINIDSLQSMAIKSSAVNLDPSEGELLLRQEVAEIERYSLRGENTYLKGQLSLFFNPAVGAVVKEFNPEMGSIGVGIRTQPSSPVSAIADGVVVLAMWDIEQGGTVVVKHSGDFIAIYKQLLRINKKEGQSVKAGEAIAMASTDEGSGSELYFELWQGGHPVNPFNFLNFK